MTREHSLLHRAVEGAAAGMIATIPMTAAMLIIQRLLPSRQQSKLEPRRISDEMLRRTGLQDDVQEEQRRAVALASHFGYGTAVGSIYPIAEPYIPLPDGIRGPAFGLGIWAASYLGWLPAAEILPHPRCQPLGRSILLIAAHLIWGATLDHTTKSFTTIRQRKSRTRKDFGTA